MSDLRVVPIVEGHGDVPSVRILLERIWQHLGGEYIEVLRPIRVRRSRLIAHPSEVCKAVSLALLNLSEKGGRGLVLILLDADEDAPCRLGPELHEQASTGHAGLDVCCVLANKEYETWFVAAAESLGDLLELTDIAVPSNPEESRSGKAWIDAHFRGDRYSETVDQPRFTQRMDLALCRSRSPSFDKLCRELEKRLQV